jgi:hypothetical protein
MRFWRPLFSTPYQALNRNPCGPVEFGSLSPGDGPLPLDLQEKEKFAESSPNLLLVSSYLG